MDEFKQLVPCYTPEWNFSIENDRDSGNALVKVFVEILMQIINSLNQMPQRNFIEFMNLIGIANLPASASKVPITVKLSDNVNHDVLLKIGTKFEAEANSMHPALTFESVEDMLVTQARLIDIYCSIKSIDTIFKYSLRYLNQKPFTLFSAENEDHSLNSNIQEHILYLSHSDLFNIKSDKIILELNIAVADENDIDRIKGLFDHNGSVEIVTWEYGWKIDAETQLEIKDTSKILNSKVSKKNGMISIELKKINDQEKEIQRLSVNGIDSRWIRCRLLPLANSPDRERFWKALKPNILKDILISVSTADQSSLSPDFLAHNDVPLQEKMESGRFCSPFGNKPSSLDSFYIASGDGFSKKGESIQIDITFDITNSNKKFFNSGDEYPILAWEYWNGRGWALLDDVRNENINPDMNRISFICPLDIEPVTIIGQTDYWIRVRIVSGDYGRPLLKLIIKNGSLYWEEDLSAVKEPRIKSILIAVKSVESKVPMHCLTYNNVQYTSHLNNAGKFDPLGFNIFNGIEDIHPTVYLGFDKKLENGPVHLYIDLTENLGSEKNDKSNLSFEYYSGALNKWNRLKAEDGTDSFAKKGDIRFAFPSDFNNKMVFGNDIYWIKCVDNSNIFLSPLSKFKDDMQKLIGFNKGNLRVFLANNSNNSNNAISLPKINALFLNTVLSINATKKEKQVLGSSNGQPNQSFALLDTIILENDYQEEIWINEGLAQILEIDISQEEIQQTKDSNGNIIDSWVLWRKAEDFRRSGPNDRVFVHNTIDKKYVFGDGIRGKIPPTGVDNIQITYFIGGGIQGNVNAKEIRTLKDFVPYVDSVLNPLPADGGIDRETTDSLLVRGSEVLRNRNRAVSALDYESLIHGAFPSLAKIKCSSGIDSDGKLRSGHITIVIIPSSSEERPIPTIALINNVKEYLLRYSAQMLMKDLSIKVIPPVYVTTSITADIYPADPSSAAIVKNKALDKLSTFLNSLYGGFDGMGWNFGSPVHAADIYMLFKNINEIDHVSNILITFDYDKSLYNESFSSSRIDSKEKSQYSPIQDSKVMCNTANLPPNSIICNGIHNLTIKYKEG